LTVQTSQLCSRRLDESVSGSFRASKQDLENHFQKVPFLGTFFQIFRFIALTLSGWMHCIGFFPFVCPTALLRRNHV
jgi:hypothetical protein